MPSELPADGRNHDPVASCAGADAGGGAVVRELLPPSPAACHNARQLVKRTLARSRGPQSSYTAELVVSELSANAVRHARSTFEVSVAVLDEVVRVAVTDAARLPTGWDGFRVASDHGLGIVQALCSSWGVEPLAGGKVVWAHVDVDGL